MMLSRSTFSTLARATFLHALLFAAIQLVLSVNRKYSVLPGLRVLGTVTSVPGPETALSCCIECGRTKYSCDASNFNTMSQTCELVEYSTDPVSLKADQDWILFYYNPIQNLSLSYGAKASKSSIAKLESHVASLAIDGNRSSDMHYCSSTGYDFDPWWQVDLTVQMHVKGLHIWNRHDTYDYSAKRLTNIAIYVSPTYEGLGDARYVCADLPGPPSPLYMNPVPVTCAQGMSGRYIRLHETYDRILHLCEVELNLF